MRARLVQLDLPEPSPLAKNDAVADAGERRCGWCKASLTAARATSWCSKRCRQTAWRFRQVRVAEDHAATPMRLAYADPPYPGKAKRYYAKEPSYRGEVDQVKLLRDLAGYDGWALSTSQQGLRDLMPLLAPQVFICPWVKTHKHAVAKGPSNIHEYLLVKPARLLKPGVPDAFVGAVAHGGGSSLMGRKPVKFVAWAFALMGAAPCDTLEDLFPGSEMVSRCWAELCRSAPAQTPRPGAGDASTRAASDEAGFSKRFHKIACRARTTGR